MTEREFLKIEVLKLLNEKIKPFDFKLLRSACEFLQKTEFGWNKYQIVFLVRENGGWELKPSLLIRFDVVEDIFHRISEFDKKYQKGTPTIGTAIEDMDNYKGINARFELTNENQINSIVDNLFDLFENVALPFFVKFDNLSAIDEQLN
ncbi:hypothetical protein GCM10007049_16410 [Echinicola pacifica]|uniref:Uncharacterized protein n=1 Tax=Echinicola pacifica TaxID=346377 RepID=A0A918PVX1_9BACT|nr:hypothetical protein [Echinicola pacifica]GGZ24734.1 hypothetical protein GCM10007049_16410 [Echinicola pacifica]